MSNETHRVLRCQMCGLRKTVAQSVAIVVCSECNQSAWEHIDDVEIASGDQAREAAAVELPFPSDDDDDI